MQIFFFQSIPRFNCAHFFSFHFNTREKEVGQIYSKNPRSFPVHLTP